MADTVSDTTYNVTADELKQFIERYEHLEAEKRDIAEQIDGDGARFRMADAAAPTLVEDIADQSALYVLMPMRV